MTDEAPYTHNPVTTVGGLRVVGWSSPAPRCKCDGFKGQHGTDRNGRATCFHSPACGCTEYREKDR